jgi:hypothetical protein
MRFFFSDDGEGHGGGPLHRTCVSQRIYRSLLPLLFLTNAAQADTVNLRYSLQDGLGFEVAITDRYTFTATYNQVTASFSDALARAESRALLIGARVTRYAKAFGSDSFYLAGSIGSIDLEAEKTDPLGGADLQGTASSPFLGVFTGYHWFWSPINLHLGLAYVGWNLKQLTVSSGAASETYDDIQDSSAGIELGLGLSF